MKKIYTRWERRRKDRELKPVKYGNLYRSDYLKSEEWGRIRSKFLRKYDNKCQKKGCDGSCHILDVHHMNYDCLSRPGTETKLDLIVLCRKCHNLIERAKKIKMIPARHNKETIDWVTESQMIMFLLYPKYMTLFTKNGKIIKIQLTPKKKKEKIKPIVNWF